jgi:hypothetical protein
MDSSSSQCSGLPALILIDAVRYAVHIVQEQGTLGTMGTGLKRHEFGLPAAWNRRGTLGTGPQNAPKLLDYAGSRGIGKRCATDR